MDFHEYVSGIAEARYTIRKIFRIVEEQAKAAGMEPLEHQALLQVYGSAQQMLQVNSLARRLDIAPAFASRMIRQLEAKKYVRRKPSKTDGRVIEVHMAAAGREVIRSVDADVRVHVEYFQSQLPISSKRTALSIMAFYVGLELPPEVAASLPLARQSTR